MATLVLPEHCMNPSAITAQASPSRQDFSLLMDRARAEYAEMPGLSLTAAQARRLWALDDETCQALLDALVASGYLRLSCHGYVKA